MDAYICRTCAVQYAPSKGPPERCIICEDERQYVNWAGQQWTSLSELKAQGYKNVLREHEPNLTGIGIEPFFGTGQRALLVQTAQGNVLWDCAGYIDDEARAQMRALGGIAAIAVSHPHFYGAMIEWAHAFDAPIHIPEADKQWITRPDPLVRHFDGTVELVPGVTLVQTGGHFAGSTVVHWAAGAEGRGALLTGDSIQVVQDRHFVSFMWSYPNLVPLSVPTVASIVETVAPYTYDRLYGGWWHTVIESGARGAVERSAERYIRLIAFGHIRGKDEAADLPHSCTTMDWVMRDRRSPVCYDDTFREYSIALTDRTHVTMTLCPFCGAELPPSLRDEWFERLDALGLDEEDPRVPEEMRDGTWWRKQAERG